MRLLALSDIHNNLAVVQRLRDQERNLHEAVIVAGDLGNDGAIDIMTILSTFDCPALYVLGNWDGEIPYDRDFGPDCHHLHHASVYISGWAFAGYSGVPDNWGLNPIEAELQAEVERKYAGMFAQADELERIEAEAQKLAELHAKWGDWRRKAYPARAEGAYAKKHQAVEKARCSSNRLRQTENGVPMRTTSGGSAPRLWHGTVQS